MTPKLPEWVEKRDGRREPFDADKISQSLFAATEAVESPNAFLARELTDGVLHFLGQENEAETIGTGQIAEVIEKVVRELGQPGLARVLEQRLQPALEQTPPRKASRTEGHYGFSLSGDPSEIVDGFMRAYSLQAIYSRDIAAAHEAGLLELHLKTPPRLLDAIVVDPPESTDGESAWMRGWSQVRKASKRTRRLVVDGADLLYATHGPEWLEGFGAALEAYQAFAHLHLRPAIPPSWASDLSAGPLFGQKEQHRSPDDLVITMLERAAKLDVSVCVHLQPRDVEDPGGRLLVDAILDRLPKPGFISLVLDRPRQPVRLKYGLSREHPATLMHVGLLLRKFIALPEVSGDIGKMLAKLPSLMRMAVSAGVQRRNYLRKTCPELTRGFLLERAQLVVEPFDLKPTVTDMTGVDPAQSPLGLKAGRQILQTLREAARQESRASGLDIVLDETYGVYLTTDLERADAGSQQTLAGNWLQDLDDGAFYVIGLDLPPRLCWTYLNWAWRNQHVRYVQLVTLPSAPLF